MDLNNPSVHISHVDKFDALLRGLWVVMCGIEQLEITTLSYGPRYGPRGNTNLGISDGPQDREIWKRLIFIWPLGSRYTNYICTKPKEYNPCPRVICTYKWSLVLLC